MTETSWRLIYYSRSMMAGDDPAVLAGIRQILAASQRNNARVGVTGALIFNSGCFAQVLEGAQANVSETFERIQRDPRHSNVLVLEYAPTARRTFASWSMAFVGEAQRHRALFGPIEGESGYDPKAMTAEKIFGTLQRLVREEERAAPAA